MTDRTTEPLPDVQTRLTQVLWKVQDTSLKQSKARLYQLQDRAAAEEDVRRLERRLDEVDAKLDEILRRLPG